MGGDLNLKKSWHPVLMSNQRKVWEEERNALQERKRIDQIMKERAEERQIQDLQEAAEAAGGKKRLNRVDWMYNGPSTGQAGTTEEMEGYLLGKRRIDTLLKDKENKRLEKAATEESFIALQHANTARDTASKIRDDPLLMVKRQEQETFESMMKDPIKRRALLKAAGQGAEELERDRKHRKHRHHRDRDRHRDHERHRDGDRRDRRHDRSRSPRRRSPEPYHSRRRSSPYGRPDRRRSFSYSSSDILRDGSPPIRRRSRSPYQRSSNAGHRRSPSPYRRSRSPNRSSRRSPEPYYPKRRSPDERRLKHSKSWHEPRRRDFSPAATDDRAAKLAAMQRLASDLDQDREKRLKAVAAEEAAQLEREEAARTRSSKYGGKGEFLTRINRQVGELGVGDRIHRGRNGFKKEED